MTGLAALLKATGDLAAGARALYERALAICEKQFGPEHPRTARVKRSLAALLDAIEAERGFVANAVYWD